VACDLTVNEIVNAVGGLLIQGDPNFKINGIGTDSRFDLTGKCFFPLKGDIFDGHDYIQAAIKQNTSVVITHKDISCSVNHVSIIKVSDTLKALQDLALYWRKQLKSKVIAISGSNGKTTSKEFTKCLLGQNYKVTASQASFNNHWGVPLTLLSVNRDDDIAIIEMGMNHLGELKNLSKIAEQDVSVVTTIGRAHVGEVGSFENIVKAKKELYDFSPGAQHIFNLDNKETNKIYLESSAKDKMSFSNKNKDATVFLYAEKLELSRILVKGHINGVSSEAWVPIFGKHNVYNVMVASCLALTCGMSADDIWSQLGNIKGTWGRSEIKNSKEGYNVIFDAYNANPESVLALHSTVNELDYKGKKYFIIGDMLEMGEESEQLHLQVIEKIKPYYDGLWYIGQHTESIHRLFDADKIGKNVFLSSTYEVVLAMKFHSMLNPEDLVLIKGSRGMKLESILEAWKVS